VKTWTFRYRPKDSISFKRLSLGRYPELGLSAARERAEKQRVSVADGNDPQGERRAKREAESRALTFDALADAYIERYAKPHKSSWKNDELYLRVHVRPAWGERKAKSIVRADAGALLDQIAKTAPTSANRTQSILSKVFVWAIEWGLLEVNPVARMQKRAKEKPKDRTLPPDEIKVLWRAIGTSSETTAAALRFLLLAGQRPGEIAGAKIAELSDLDNGARARLEISADRMKGRRAHIVPLAPMMLAIVKDQIARATLGQEHIFPSKFTARGPIARHSLSHCLQRIIAGLNPNDTDAEAVASLNANPPTPHDFRRTVATGLAALGLPREDRLAVLGHTQGDVHAAHYDRHDRFAEKRRALEAWEAHVAAIIDPAPASTNVVQIGARK
jgi:integrase